MSAGPNYSFSIMIGGFSADDLAASFNELEVEESVDTPGAFSLVLPVNITQQGDYDVVNDPRLAPLSNVAILATASDGNPQCLFDGYVLAQTAHLDTGTVASTLRVWGQDATWLMNTTEQVREWADLTDGDVANSIFDNYGFTPDPTNLDDDSPTHTSDGSTLMQRATDAQFLRTLARRNGKLFRVFCTDTPRIRTEVLRPTLARRRPRHHPHPQRFHRRHRRFPRHHLGRPPSLLQPRQTEPLHRQ